MGFFDDIGSLIGDLTSSGEEIKQTVNETVEGFTQSAEDLAATKDELLGNIDEITGTSNAGEDQPK